MRIIVHLCALSVYLFSLMNVCDCVVCIHKDSSDIFFEPDAVHGDATLVYRFNRSMRWEQGCISPTKHS